MPRGQGFCTPSSHVSEMHRALWMQLFREAGSQVKQWPWPGPFWGAPKPVCCSGGSKAGGFHSYFYGVGRVVNRVAQVKRSQTLVLLLRYSSFSWVNSLQMVVSLWLISREVDLDNFASIFMVFMEDWVYGGPDGAILEGLPSLSCFLSFYVVVASLFMAKWHWGSIISQPTQCR